jgi:hypothetical protein
MATERRSSVLDEGPIREVVARQFGRIDSFVALSRSNSRVWRATCGGTDFVVKLLTDSSSDVIVERALLDELSGMPCVRPILAVQPLGDAFVVLSQYIDGTTLDEILASGAYDAADALRWACDLELLQEAVATRPVRGFGRCDSAFTAPAESWSEFLREYLEEQRSKAPQTAAWAYARMSSLLTRVQHRIDEEVGQPRAILADINNRNFCVRASDRRLVLLNAPVVWCADPAHPYGESMIHHDETALGAAFLKRAAFPRWRLHLYASMNAYIILAYAERFSSVPLSRVAPWGRTRPLRELFDQHMRLLQRALE